MTDDQVMAAAAAIRCYLSSRPQAKDSAEGIHQWWIAWDGGAPALIDVTAAALDHLEAEGVLERFQSGSRELWRRRGIAVLEPAA
jgi:hypothetical protein